MKADIAKNNPNDSLNAGFFSNAAKTREFPSRCFNLSCCTRSRPYLEATWIITTDRPRSSTKVLEKMLIITPETKPVTLPPESCFKSSGSSFSCLGGAERLVIGRGVSRASSRSLGCLKAAMLVPRDRPTMLAPRAWRGRKVRVRSLADIFFLSWVGMCSWCL